jgi:hypothetical protein
MAAWFQSKDINRWFVFAETLEQPGHPLKLGLSGAGFGTLQDSFTPSSKHHTTSFLYSII